MKYIYYFILVMLLYSCAESNSELETSTNSDYSYMIPDSSVVGCWKLSAIKLTNRKYDLNGIPLPSLKSNHLKYSLSESDSMVYDFLPNYDVRYNGSKIAEWSIKSNGIYLLQTDTNVSSPIILNTKYDYIFNQENSRQFVTMLYGESHKPMVLINYLIVKYGPRDAIAHELGGYNKEG